MAKTKKTLALLLSAAMTLSVFPMGLNASAETDVTKILNSENSALALWVKADDGIQNGVWKDNSGKGNDLQAQLNTNPIILDGDVKGHSAIKLRNEIGDGTYFTTKYDTEYTGDSTVFMVTKIHAYEDYKGLYSTGDGITQHTPETYENMLMSYGKTESYYYNDASAEQNKDRSSQAMDRTIPLDTYMNYTYRITQDGSSVKAKYMYTNSEGVEQAEEWGRGDTVNNAFLKHTGFVLGNRDKFEEFGVPDMDVAEVIVVLGTMTDEDITTVRNYLNTKYYGSGYDPFAPDDYSTQVLPDQNDPAENTMPLANDERVALWVDGESFDKEAATWYDKSVNENNMQIAGNIDSRVSEEMNDHTVVHFPGDSTSAASVKLPQVYQGSSMIYFVYKPYKVDDPEAPDSYNYSYKGIFTTDYLPRTGELLGRCGGIDIRHGGDGVEIGFQSAGKSQGLGETPDVSYSPVEKSFIWNAGQTNTAAGSSYLGYTRGFLDFEVETVVGSESTSINIDFKDAEGSVPNINTDTEDKRGINRTATTTWSTTSGEAKADMHYGYTIGNRWDQNGTGLLMDVAEMIVIHGTLTEQEKSEISEYLNKKYFSKEETPQVSDILLAKNMSLNYKKADGSDATNGVSEAATMDVKGTLTNKYRPNDTDAIAIAAVYEGDMLYDVKLVDVTGISADGASFTIEGVNLPDDKSDVDVKIMAWSDAENSCVPVMDYVYANISVF